MNDEKQVKVQLFDEEEDSVINKVIKKPDEMNQKQFSVQDMDKKQVEIQELDEEECNSHVVKQKPDHMDPKQIPVKEFDGKKVKIQEFVEEEVETLALRQRPVKSSRKEEHLPLSHSLSFGSHSHVFISLFS